MNKVEELVEWAAKILKEDDGLDQQMLYADFEIDHYTDLAKQILSHPDLALIDMRRQYDKVLIGVLVSLQDRLDADKDLAEIKAIGYVVAILESVIPLAEALKR